MPVESPRVGPLRFALFGVPGPITVWMSVALRALMLREAGENFDGVVLDSDQHTEDFLSGEKGENLFIISHFPRRELIDWLERENIPLVVALDDCLPCILHQMQSMRAGPLEGVRPVTQSLSLIHYSNRLTRRAVITDEFGTVNIAMLIEHIARDVFACPISDVPTMLARSGLDPAHDLRESIESNPHISALVGDIEPIPEHLHPILRDVCEPLRAMVQGKNDVSIVWNVQLFYDGGSHRLPAPAAMNLVGPARCLYYGPYLHLPVGHYDVMMMIGLSDEIRNTILRAEFYTHRPEASFIVVADAGGFYKMPFDIDVTDSRAPIQFRIFIEQGEIEGRIAFALACLYPS